MNRVFAFVALLVAITACAQEPVSSSVKDSLNVMGPYLGKWRPTSAAEERNVGHIVVESDRLVLADGSGLKFRRERQTSEAVIVRVIESIPIESDAYTGALAFSLETQERNVQGATPPRKTSRQLLVINWCERLEQLSESLSRSACSRNVYMR